MMKPRFSLEDADRTYDEWGSNCGPGAIAAIMGLTLDEVRPHMGDFERKRYTNPTLMWATLQKLGAKFSYRGGDLGRENWPDYGLARVQWEGPWTATGVPIRARYRHTHWVGTSKRPTTIGIFDINCMNNGSGWVDVSDWVGIVVPWLLSMCEPKASGQWHITHAVEIKRPLQLSPERP